MGHLVGELGPDVGHEKNEHDDTRNCSNNLQGDDEIIREIHCLKKNFQSFLVFLFVEALEACLSNILNLVSTVSSILNLFSCITIEIPSKS